MVGVPTTAPDPSAPSIGFRTVAREAFGDLDWSQGISYALGDCTNPVRGIPQCQATDLTDAQRTAGTNISVLPFEFIVSGLCRDGVLPSQEGPYDAETLATIEANTSGVLAQELWNGSIRAGNAADPTPHSLVHAVTTQFIMPVGTTATAYWARVFELRWSAGLDYEAFVVHVPPSLIPAMVDRGFVNQVGGRYVGPFNIPVLTDAGYQAVADQGFTNGDFDPNTMVWTYVTGPVRYALTAPRLIPEPEQRQAARRNRYEVWARRMAIVDFDSCPAFALAVTPPLTSDTVGS